MIKILISVGLVLSSLAASEALLRILSGSLPRVAAVLDPAGKPIIQDSLLGHRPSPAHPDHDEWGFRNQQRPAQVRVVAIGDSQTYGISVAREAAWPALLAARTGLPTYSMSYGGYGPGHYLLLAREAKTLQPELLVVGFYSGNDIADTWGLVFRRKKIPELLTRGAPDEESLRGDRLSTGQVWIEMRAAWEGVSVESKLQKESAWRRLKLVGLGLGLYRLWWDPPGRQSSRKDHDWERAKQRVSASGVGSEVLYAFEHELTPTVLTPRTHLVALNRDDPRNEFGLRACLDALWLIRDEWDGRAELLVLLIPTKSLAFYDLVSKRGGAPAELHKLAVEESAIWSEIREFLDARGIAWLDTLPALRDSLARGRSPYYTDVDSHFNELGNALVADLVARHPTVKRLSDDH